ncbi:restriction endonuclease subunit S [Aeromonas caviae]|uniref:restriction endonuclease subunit S n=1 Tax=Aeromonas caviae TaxID=648 RepID=UPI0038D189FD
MSSEWISTTLGEVTSWMSGGTPKKDVAAYWNGDIPWISANSMYGTRYSDSDLRITREGLANGSRLAPESSVLLLVRGGALHNRIPVGIATREVAFNQDVKALLAKRDRLNPWYLLFWLMGQERFLLDSVVEFTGIGAGKLDTQRMQALPFLLPKLEEQNTIVALAKGIDDRITLLRETNTTLEAIAQALFKSWFVDFDPVHARARGEQPAGLSPEVAALFPDSFEDSELGMVPKGWMVEPLDEIADFLNGLALQKFPPDGDADLPVIKIAQLRKGDAVGADRASSKIKPEYIIQSGDVLFSWSGSLEVEVWCGGEGALNQHLFKVTSQRFQKWFYLHWTKHHLANFKHIAASKATTMGHIQRRHLTEAMVVVPSPEFLVEADKVFAPLLEQWINNALQAQTLATLRDTLLPRLISGQLRLPEAEVTLQEAGI